MSLEQQAAAKSVELDQDMVANEIEPDEVTEVDVVFRVDRESKRVYAIFPGVCGTNDAGTCTIFDPLGGHATADPLYTLGDRIAKPDEYAKLKRYLENSYGYKLRVIKRMRSHHHEARKAEIARMAAIPVALLLALLMLVSSADARTTRVRPSVNGSGYYGRGYVRDGIGESNYNAASHMAQLRSLQTRWALQDAKRARRIEELRQQIEERRLVRELQAIDRQER